MKKWWNNLLRKLMFKEKTEVETRIDRLMNDFYYKSVIEGSGAFKVQWNQRMWEDQDCEDETPESVVDDFLEDNGWTVKDVKDTAK